MNKALLIVCVVVIGLGSVEAANVFNMPTGLTSLETVHVGNPGNANDTHGDGYGGVAYEYNIGKFEVTAGQYCEFLNAVAKTDTYALYDTEMSYGHLGHGCRIQRHGSSGSYSYSVASDWANHPVNFVSWYDALRFSNWLTNGQPSGPQGNGTTEMGSYTLTGIISVNPLPDHATLAAGTTTKWLLTSEDEWYKAAYYKGGGTNAGYWDYPTQSDTPPTAELPVGTDMVNGSANFNDGGSWGDPTYFTTEVGVYTAKPSDSAYGTFDQGGNFQECNEAISGLYNRGLRGGSYNSDAGTLHVTGGYFGGGGENAVIGFRIVQVPEPATLTLLAIGGLALVRRRKRGMCK